MRPEQLLCSRSGIISFCYRGCVDSVAVGQRLCNSVRNEGGYQGEGGKQVAIPGIFRRAQRCAGEAWYVST